MGWLLLRLFYFFWAAIAFGWAIWMSFDWWSSIHKFSFKDMVVLPLFLVLCGCMLVFFGTKLIDQAKAGLSANP